MLETRQVRPPMDVSCPPWSYGDWRTTIRFDVELGLLLLEKWNWNLLDNASKCILVVDSLTYAKYHVLKICSGGALNCSIWKGWCL